MQELGNDLKVDNGFASGCAPQTVDDSDDDDILENWDDEDADGGRSTRVANSIDDSEDEVFSCAPLVTVFVYFILLRNLLCIYFASIIYTSALNMFNVNPVSRLITPKTITFLTFTCTCSFVFKQLLAT